MCVKRAQHCHVCTRSLASSLLHLHRLVCILAVCCQLEAQISQGLVLLCLPHQKLNTEVVLFMALYITVPLMGTNCLVMSLIAS